MNLYIPTTFTLNFVHKILELNKQITSNCINEVYGSLPYSPFGSARPRINLPNINLSTLEKHVTHLNKNGISFNYLANSPYIEKLDPNNNGTVVDFFDEIFSIIGNKNNNSITIASDKLYDFMKSRYNNVNLVVSFVLDIKDKKDIEYFVKKGASKIILSNTRNRDFSFLKMCGEYFPNKITLMANESCLFNCKDKKRHYLFAAKNSSSIFSHENSKEFYDPFMASCFISKFTDLTNFLKSSWIRPSDLHYYEKVGIKQIKIGDRTKNEEWLLNTTIHYIQNKNPKNFFELLAITPDNIAYATKCKCPDIFIDNNVLDEFVKYFYDNEIDCLDRRCIECDICSKFSKNAIRVDKNECDNFVNCLKKLYNKC